MNEASLTGLLARARPIYSRERAVERKKARDRSVIDYGITAIRRN